MAHNDAATVMDLTVADLEYLEGLATDADALRSKAVRGTYNYTEFVEKLFKHMQDGPGSIKGVETVLHAAVGIAGEGGELLDCIKKAWAYSKPLDFENMVEELGDLRFYYQAMLNLFNLSDDDVKAANVRKLEKRYPGGVYSDADAQARADKLEASNG